MIFDMHGAIQRDLSNIRHDAYQNAAARPKPRPSWLPDDAATHWPNGDPVTLRDVLDAKNADPLAFWIHPLPKREIVARETYIDVSGYMNVRALDATGAYSAQARSSLSAVSA